ncbi:site-specific integrase [Arthrobacter sp. efr-133-R2A-63]|uniref:site-specific integrase n=1 Tax=Arthrobacter sp. efr-133-R2A-63 TaxID=3040278 RepID=UPI00254F7A6F|nr:site-specific integrase [Arthrobacter sp. efr-133-R2A-63]
MTPQQRPNATRATSSVTSCSTGSPGCSIATRTQPHTATAETRHSYITHLVESGMDALFVQHQAGHEHASTTALYTSVSSDFRVKTLRRALDSTVRAALGGMED